jgi:tetratricopeptide (TPR) repeat protein
VFSAALTGLSLSTFIAVFSLRRFRYPAVGWLWYLGTLFPVIGIVQIGEQALADRYSYVPLIGLFIIASWGSADLLRRWRAPRHAFTAVCLVVPCVLAVPAWRQAGYWKDDRVLFARALEATEANFIAHNNLGGALYLDGENEEAARHLEAALRIRPGYAMAASNLGNVYDGLGRTEDALRAYEHALLLDPGAYEVHFNLARLLARIGRTQEAIAHYQRAAERKPALAPRVRRILRTLEARP